MEQSVERGGEAVKKREQKYEKKYGDLKSKFKEVKGILKGYMNRVIDLEEEGRDVE